ncbi:MAG: hypothetical protein P4M00_16505 [Azospirillaceae bacterium]|nr:hypothetical protein [Azospirillaceae bacterium]
MREQAAHFRIDMFGITEHAVALGDTHGANLTRPGEDILEQMPMNRPVMGVAKAPLWQGLFAALCRNDRLEGIEFSLIVQAKAVFENAGARITVRVGAAFVHCSRQRPGCANRATIWLRRSSASTPSWSNRSIVSRISGVSSIPSTALMRAKAARPRMTPRGPGEPGRRGGTCMVLGEALGGSQLLMVDL